MGDFGELRPENVREHPHDTPVTLPAHSVFRAVTEETSVFVFPDRRNATFRFHASEFRRCLWPVGCVRCFCATRATASITRVVQRFILGAAGGLGSVLARRGVASGSLLLTSAHPTSGKGWRATLHLDRTGNASAEVGVDSGLGAVRPR